MEKTETTEVPHQDVVRHTEEPEIIRLTETDVLQALLLQANRQTLEVQLQNIRLQEQAFAAQMTKRYGIDMSQYTIDADLKVAKRTGQR